MSSSIRLDTHQDYTSRWMERKTRKGVLETYFAVGASKARWTEAQVARQLLDTRAAILTRVGPAGKGK